MGVLVVLSSVGPWSPDSTLMINNNLHMDERREQEFLNCIDLDSDALTERSATWGKGGAREPWFLLLVPNHLVAVCL